MEKLIGIDHDGSYQAIMVFDKKSYVLKDWNDKLTLKGQTLKGRSNEPFVLRFIRDCIERMFTTLDIRDLYDDTMCLLENRLLTFEDIAKSANLNKTLEGYMNDKKANPNVNPQAAYELAIASPRKYQKGDVIKFYIQEPPMETVEVRGKMKTRKAKLPNFRKARLEHDFAFDYDITYYSKRLKDATKRFLPILGEEGYTSNFPEFKLTKKDKTKLNLL